MSITANSSKVVNGVISLLNEKYGESGYALKSLKIEVPCSAGDNFMSSIYALSAEVKLNSQDEGTDGIVNHQWIAKAQLITQDVQQYMYQIIFNKERLMYTEMLARMENLSEETNKYENSVTPLAPTLHHFYSEGDAYSCLFMDNLVSQSFYLPDTHGAGVGLEECQSIMRAIARFHALSLVIEGQDAKPLPEEYAICSAEFLIAEVTATQMLPIVQGSYNGVIQLAEKFRPDLVPLLVDFNNEESVWDRLCRLVKPGMSSFSCLCHGDARLNNIFINTDDIQSVRFIDFQLTRYASPLTDLQYILKMGATKEFRNAHTDQVLQTYFDEFQSVLSNFPSVTLLSSQETAVRGWTFAKLKEEYEELTTYGFLMAMTLLPIVLLRPGDMNKSVSQMSKQERDEFWQAGRQAMVFELGSKHEDVRERLFDICDESFAIINPAQQ